MMNRTSQAGRQLWFLLGSMWGSTGGRRGGDVKRLRDQMAERGGFEPPVDFKGLRRFSKPLLSTTQPPLRCLRGSQTDGSTGPYFFTKTAMYWLFGTKSRFETSRNPLASTSLIRSS